MTKTIEEQIHDFLTDPDVQFSKDWPLSRDAFNILGLKENGHSKMIAWLLNPKEGHYLGDYFIKQLLSEAFIACSSNDVNPFTEIGFDSILDIENQSFHETFVELEFSVGEYGRVDIALINYSKKLIVFIENKYTASIHGDQLSNYREWRCANEEFRKICIFMDYSENSTEELPDWISLNYDWLIQACNNIINRERLPVDINILIRDYYCFLVGSYDTTPALKDVERRFSKIYNKHRKLLDTIENKKFSQIKHSSLLSSKKKQEDLSLYHFYLSYKDFLEELFEYDQFDHIEELLKKRLSGKNLATDINYKRSYLDFRNEKWSSLVEENTEEYWGLYIRLKAISDQKNFINEQIVIQVRLWKPNLSEEGWQYIEKLACLFDKKIRKNAETFTLYQNEIDETEPSDIVDQLVEVFQQVDNILSSQ